MKTQGQVINLELKSILSTGIGEKERFSSSRKNRVQFAVESRAQAGQQQRTALLKENNDFASANSNVQKRGVMSPQTFSFRSSSVTNSSQSEKLNYEPGILAYRKLKMY